MKIRFNYSKNPDEVFEKLIKDSTLRDEIRSNDKYVTVKWGNFVTVICGTPTGLS